MANRELLIGAGIGASLVYLFDAERGRRRRAVLRDSAVSAMHTGADAADATARDTRNRITGAAAEVRGWWRADDTDDDTVVNRVRSKLGRLVSHPHAIEVTSEQGVVTLSGPILQREVARLLRAVEEVRGVREVVNQLDEHKQAGDVPALQGGVTPPGIRSDLFQREWAPATRMTAAIGGVALTASGLRRRNVPGWMLMAAGAGLIARAATNLEARRLVGIGARRRAVDVQKTITIDAPIENVYRFWAAYENFPRFMSRVLEVRASTRQGQSHWTVAGPSGMPIEFDAEVTQAVPNRIFAWRTIEGSFVEHSGLVHFDTTADGRTRIHIRMSYNPPAGWLGHGIAKTFGVDPKSSLDADLARMKTLIETGRPPHDAAQRQTSDAPTPY